MCRLYRCVHLYVHVVRKTIGLFCRISSLLQGSFAKETYICMCMWYICMYVWYGFGLNPKVENKSVSKLSHGMQLYVCVCAFIDDTFYLLHAYSASMCVCV